MIDPTYLTESSRNKYIDDISTDTLDPKFRKILDTMFAAFKQKLVINIKQPIGLAQMRKKFLDLHNEFCPIKDSKFVSDIRKFDRTITYTLNTPNGTITLNFIFSGDRIKIISALIHAIHTFCHFFGNADYRNLVLYICLDENKRDVAIPAKYKTYDEKIACLQRKSMALNVSGMTDKKKKIVFLTRIEEIIKLMFHEMVHFIGLDERLRYVDYTNGWAILPANLNISETYTEFMAVLLNAAYQSIHLWSIEPKQKMEQIYASILHLETIYSLRLTADILKFYGYDSETYRNFFTGIGRKNKEPIPLWEYIFLRTICMLKMDFPANYEMKDIDGFVELINDDKDLVKRLAKYIITPMGKNISYNMIDLDWGKL